MKIRENSTSSLVVKVLLLVRFSQIFWSSRFAPIQQRDGTSWGLSHLRGIISSNGENPSVPHAQNYQLSIQHLDWVSGAREGGFNTNTIN